MEYQCYHGSKKRDGLIKQGRRRTHTQKINCGARIRINFIEKNNKVFRIKIFVFEHNHEIGKDFYQHYASQRKPDLDGLKEILKNYSKMVLN